MRRLAAVAILLGVVLVGGLGAEWAWLALGPKGADVPAPNIPGGSLVIVGGGKTPESIRAEFLRRAGGRSARIVVIPTARLTADWQEEAVDLAVWKARGVASAERLHTRSRQEANKPAFVRPLEKATGVWLSGGNQAWLVATYKGTEVERQLRALLDRGGVIGGSSAGAAAMSGVMIAGDSAEGPLVKPGLGFLDGAIVDQHFLRRNRLTRLLRVLSSNPTLVGLGIDEKTALIVDVRDRRLRVVGESYVMACIPSDADHPSRFEILRPGDETSLAALRQPEPTIAHALDLGDDGVSPP